jgi:hypothetical protein
VVPKDGDLVAEAYLSSLWFRFLVGMQRFTITPCCSGVLDLIAWKLHGVGGIRNNRTLGGRKFLGAHWNGVWVHFMGAKELDVIFATPGIQIGIIKGSDLSKPQSRDTSRRPNEFGHMKRNSGSSFTVPRLAFCGEEVS